MTQRRAWAFGASLLTTLVSFSVLGLGCAGGEVENTVGGVPCIPEAEHCGDDFDNDCDGKIDKQDDDCPCRTGDKQACYTGSEATRAKGACADGEQTCGDFGDWGDCEDEVLPAVDDACDGIDNDCDGMTDTTCACSPPIPETTQPCYTGVAGTEGVGECKPGANFCKTDGTWDDQCEGEVLPADEECDSLDNDCNGVADDMGMTTCGVGACQVTVTACENGVLTQCTAKPPSKEVCDGVDNDCDQLTDENDPEVNKACDSGKQGICAPGKIACQAGALVCVPDLQAGVEKCDGLDNDCDGQVDDNILGTGGGCSTGIPGVCASGQIKCQNFVIDCFPITPPSTEVCDGLDNDCDEATDENDPGGGSTCDTGKPGVCQQGTEHCVDGAIQCTPNVAGQPETCDGIDNNCDAAVDEGNPGGNVPCATGLQGACAQGVKNCINGSLQCVPNVQPQAEVCDGTDNDCNGVVDQGNPGGGAACSTGLQGVCAAGTITCQSGALLCKQNQIAGAEICGNNLDDNCDGQPDPMVTVYFSEDFANNSKGWLLDVNKPAGFATQWAIGPAAVSSGHSYGNADPSQDHTPTADNGIAGVVLGGNASTSTHGFMYLESPTVDISMAPTVFLEFFRWLNSDYASYMVNRVEVYNGATWSVIWESGTSPGVQDNAWNKQSYNVTAYKNANFKFRFGFSVGSGAYTVSQWNVDDVSLVSAQCN